MRTVTAMALMTLVSCAAKTGPTTDESPATEQPEATQQAEAPDPDELEAAEADWRARQDEINQVLSSMDRTTFIGESPTKGNPNADVVVVKFSDFECPRKV